MAWFDLRLDPTCIFWAHEWETNSSHNTLCKRCGAYQDDGPYLSGRLVNCYFGFHYFAKGADDALLTKLHWEHRAGREHGEECLVCGITQELASLGHSHMKCGLGFHVWKDSCEECSICGRTRLNAHTWDVCKCTKCGAQRDQSYEGHDWSKDCEECSRCGQKLDKRHADHRWGYGRECIICKTKCDLGHKWRYEKVDELNGGDKCMRCGKRRAHQHDYFFSLRNTEKCFKCGETYPTHDHGIY